MGDDFMERLARVEERDTARGREFEDLRAAFKENTLATRTLTATLTKMQLEAAYDRGKERGLAMVLGFIGSVIALVGNFMIHGGH